MAVSKVFIMNRLEVHHSFSSLESFIRFLSVLITRLLSFISLLERSERDTRYERRVETSLTTSFASLRRKVTEIDKGLIKRIIIVKPLSQSQSQVKKEE